MKMHGKTVPFEQRLALSKVIMERDMSMSECEEIITLMRGKTQKEKEQIAAQFLKQLTSEQDSKTQA